MHTFGVCVRAPVRVCVLGVGGYKFHSVVYRFMRSQVLCDTNAAAILEIT